LVSAQSIIFGIIYFLVWTLLLYWMHRAAHVVPFLKTYHLGHHQFIVKNEPTWHWTNIFIFQDNKVSTIDVWLTEIIPTLLFCYITGQWWIAVIFYIWSAFIQEAIEHNRKFNIFPISTSGKWHLVHHFSGPYNYGIFHPFWDMLFRTYKTVP